MQKFAQLPVGTAFRVKDTWQRTDVDTDTVYVKIDDQQGRPGRWQGEGYVAGTMPRVQFANEHPVVVTV